jgi:hypothetical protein
MREVDMGARAWCVAWTSVLAVGCAPAVHIPVLAPAAVTLPADVRTLGVIDRSAPVGAGQQVLGALEGLVTGEALGGDRQAADRAIDALTATLQTSPRFQTVLPAVRPADVEADRSATLLSQAAARQLCAAAGCDALVSLEAIDSDSTVSVASETDPTTKAVTYTATRTSQVVLTWRVYEVAGGRVLDELRNDAASVQATGSGATRDAAEDAVPETASVLVDLGGAAGEAYARRIAPTPVSVRRTYYGGGDDALKAARDRVRAQDWGGAAAAWRAVETGATTDRVRGRALFNLALAYEVQGELTQARATAQQAAVVLANGRSRRYVDALDQRLADAARLAEQMQPAGPKPPPRRRPPGR